MNDRLHEVIAQCAVIHEHNINKNIIYDLNEVQDALNEYDSDVKEHYLTLLMQFYFQKNSLSNLQELLLQGFRFDMRFTDVVEAFCNLKDDEDNVIEFFEENVLMLRDKVTKDDLERIYNYYKQNEKYENFIKEPLEIIKRNRYVCAKAYKLGGDLASFFIIEDLLESLKRDMPFLLD